MSGWRRQKPDTVGWWAYAFRSPVNGEWCIESSYWNVRYLEAEQATPRYEDGDVWWLAVATPDDEPTPLAVMDDVVRAALHNWWSGERSIAPYDYANEDPDDLHDMRRAIVAALDALGFMAE